MQKAVNVISEFRSYKMVKSKGYSFAVKPEFSMMWRSKTPYLGRKKRYIVVSRQNRNKKLIDCSKSFR